MEKKVYSVSDITFTIKNLLEESLPTIWVEGEISNLKAHFSGHNYFSLKDENTQLAAVMWRSRVERNPLTLEDGMLVQCLGNIRVYEKTGRYQLDVLQAKPAGIGNLQQAFEELKLKLMQEGLFEEEAKKPLPQFPAKIALVTSPTGAAIKDMLHVLKRRAAYVEILIFPVKVQGEGAAMQIARAIDNLNGYKDIDLIIAGRGGGSLEDLLAFNEEVVARAIYNSNIPVISAVGHEIDFTIADFVADMRAPTPSAATELAVVDRNELAGIFMGFHNRLTSLLNVKIESIRQRLLSYKKSYGFRRSPDLVFQNAQRLDELNMRRIKAFKLYYKQSLDKVKHIEKMISNLNPENILSRGYSITFSEGNVVKSIADIKTGDNVTTRLKDGNVDSTVKGTRPGKIR